MRGTRTLRISLLVLKIVSPAETRPLVDAEVRQLAVLVLLQLEREPDERLRRVGLDDDLLFLIVLVVAPR